MCYCNGNTIGFYIHDYRPNISRQNTYEHCINVKTCSYSNVSQTLPNTNRSLQLITSTVTLHIHCESKKTKDIICLQLCQMLAELKNFFYLSIQQGICSVPVSIFQPHLNCVVYLVKRKNQK